MLFLQVLKKFFFAPPCTFEIHVVLNFAFLLFITRFHCTASDLCLDLGDFISCAKNLFHLFATRYLMHRVHVALHWWSLLHGRLILRIIACSGKWTFFILRGLNYISWTQLLLRPEFFQVYITLCIQFWNDSLFMFFWSHSWRKIRIHTTYSAIFNYEMSAEFLKKKQPTR